MERRDWSVEAIERLKYIDSLDIDLKANLLTKWVDKYIKNGSIEDFELSKPNFLILSELIYKNKSFLKEYQANFKNDLNSHEKMKKFFQ